MLKAVWDHFNEGGWPMYVILLWLGCIIAISVERAIYLWGQSTPKALFLKTVQKFILAGDVQGAIKHCSTLNTSLARIVMSGMVKVNRPDDEVQAALDEAALVELPKISTRTAYLGLLSNLAMLTGLFGTVLGLIRSFGAVSKPGVDQAMKATILAEGISEAMNCTAFGLIAAILGLIGFAILNGKTQILEDDINEGSVLVMNLIVNNRQKVSLSGDS
jgi:biopolymer transport protein ExbB/TolQ